MAAVHCNNNPVCCSAADRALKYTRQERLTESERSYEPISRFVIDSFSLGEISVVFLWMHHYPLERFQTRLDLPLTLK